VRLPEVATQESAHTEKFGIRTAKVKRIDLELGLTEDGIPIEQISLHCAAVQAEVFGIDVV